MTMMTLTTPTPMLRLMRTHLCRNCVVPLPSKLSTARSSPQSDDNGYYDDKDFDDDNGDDEGEDVDDPGHDDDGGGGMGENNLHVGHCNLDDENLAKDF